MTDDPLLLHSRANTGGIRVVTLNLWGVRGDWPARQQVLSTGLRALDPDLVAFQEAITTAAYEQVDDLLSPAFHIVHHPHREADGQGISLASRWPLHDVRTLDLQVSPRTADFACTTLLAEVDVPAPIGPLLLVNHCPNWQADLEHERELQAVRAARVVEAVVGQRTLHVVVAGAFDATPDSASVRFWCGRQALGGMSVCYADAWELQHGDDPGHTFSPRNPLRSDRWTTDRGRRIDYVLVRCGSISASLDVAACARIFDAPVDGVWASDHFGVVADLVVPARAASPVRPSSLDRCPRLRRSAAEPTLSTNRRAPGLQRINA